MTTLNALTPSALAEALKREDGKPEIVAILKTPLQEKRLRALLNREFQKAHHHVSMVTGRISG